MLIQSTTHHPSPTTQHLTPTTQHLTPTTQIELLPALPKEWPTGTVKGLKARGGYTVDMAWKNGKVTEVTIKASKAGTLHLLYNNKKESHELKAHQTLKVK